MKSRNEKKGLTFNSDDDDNDTEIPIDEDDGHNSVPIHRPKSRKCGNDEETPTNGKRVTTRRCKSTHTEGERIKTETNATSNSRQVSDVITGEEEVNQKRSKGSSSDVVVGRVTSHGDLKHKTTTGDILSESHGTVLDKGHGTDLDREQGCEAVDRRSLTDGVSKKEALGQLLRQPTLVGEQAYYSSDDDSTQPVSSPLHSTHNSTTDCTNDNSHTTNQHLANSVTGKVSDVKKQAKSTAIDDFLDDFLF